MKNKTSLFLSLIIFAMIIFGFCGCKDWEYDVSKGDIHFKKIHQSKNGTNTGFMMENHDINGFPCEKGWIHFRGDWELLSFQLSEDFMYKGTLLPAHTWFHFPYHANQTGYVLSFPGDYEVQGHLCGGSGGYKGTHTGFYESGKLRSFFPPEDIVIDGVPCEASLFANVNLYEDGRIKRCKLADDYEVSGESYRRGAMIEFDEEGHVK
jgi:hypothetical protein